MKPDRSANVRLGRLDHAIGFHLRLAQSASFSAFQRLLGDKALRPGHYAILQVISDNAGLTQGGLSQAVGIDKATLSGLLRELEDRGAVMRIVDPDDRRVRKLMLRHRGVDLLAEYAACAERHDARLAEAVGPHKDEFLALLRAVTAYLSDDDRAATGSGDGNQPSSTSGVDDVHGEQRIPRRAS